MDRLPLRVDEPGRGEGTVTVRCWIKTWLGTESHRREMDVLQVDVVGCALPWQFLRKGLKFSPSFKVGPT